MGQWTVTLLFAMAAITAPAATCAAPFEAGGVKLDVTAEPEKAEIMLAEPGWVRFKLTNLSGHNRRIMDGGDYRNRLGRPDSFKIVLVGEDGKEVPQPDSGYDMGGLVGANEFPAKGEYVFRLFLPHRAMFEKPGSYTMTIQRTIETVPDDGAEAFRQDSNKLDVTATATIKIVPTDAARLGRLIESVGTLATGRNYDKAGPAMKMLGAIDDERVIPYFVKLAEAPSTERRYAACENLAKYNSDLAYETLLRLMKTTVAEMRESATTMELAESSARGVRHYATISLGKSPHPKALPLFWTFAKDDYYGMRLWVLHRANELRTPEALAIIQTMTKDEDESVRTEALRYQKEIAEASEKK